MPGRKYKIGDIIDDMKVVGFSNEKNFTYIVECIVCGRQKKVRGARLSSHVSTSHAKCIFSQEKGLYYSRLYKIWAGLRSRTTNPNNKNYKDYGGRGVSSEAFANFTDFYNAMAKPYEEAVAKYKNERLVSIDRVNVNGDYCPENCRWISIQEQEGNKRTNKNFIAQSPNKELFHSKNISLFAREHDLNATAIDNCLKQKSYTHKQWIFYYKNTEEEYITLLNNKQDDLLQKITITDPHNITYSIFYYELGDFCKKHSLDRQGAIRCLKGIYKQNNGWKFNYSNKKCNDYPEAQNA